MDKLELEDKSTSLENKPTNDNSKLQEQRSTQENKQDLDQQQQVDVKPSQINLQKIDVTVNTKLENYSGKIMGTIYNYQENSVVYKADIFLYFGSVIGFPVCKSISDQNGNFTFEELPPGFYTIKVQYHNSIDEIVPNIKVLPGQNTSQWIYLSNQVPSSNKQATGSIKPKMY